jgi:putative FmdB family regulatory protein
MPIYEYACRTCGKNFSIQAKIADAPPVRGQDCVSNKCVLEKQLSLIAAPIRHCTPSSHGQTPADTQANASEETIPASGGCGGCCSH